MKCLEWNHYPKRFEYHRHSMLPRSLVDPILQSIIPTELSNANRAVFLVKIEFEYRRTCMPQTRPSLDHTQPCPDSAANYQARMRLRMDLPQQHVQPVVLGVCTILAALDCTIELRQSFPRLGSLSSILLVKWGLLRGRLDSEYPSSNHNQHW